MIPRLNLGAVGASTFKTPNLPGMRSNRYVKTARGPGGMASAGRRAVFDFKHGFATEGAAQTERTARSSASEKWRETLLDASRRAEEKKLKSAAASATATAAAGALPAWRQRRDAKIVPYVFYAFYQEMVPESRTEINRYRCFAIRCFPQDSSLQVTEIKRANSGIDQGDFIKRTKVSKTTGIAGAQTTPDTARSSFSATSHLVLGGPDPADAGYFTVDDFTVGEPINIYGRQFMISGCDDRTRTFLEAKRGAVMPANMVLPEDKFDNMAMGQGVHDWKRKWEETGGNFGTKDSLIKRYVEASRGREDKVHPDAPGGLRRYLKQGDRILRFMLLWEDLRLHGGKQVLNLNVYLKDNTMEVSFFWGGFWIVLHAAQQLLDFFYKYTLTKTSHHRASAHHLQVLTMREPGREPFPALMKRGRLPKPELVERGAMAWRGFTQQEGPFYEPEDIKVGQTFEFNKRKFLVFDAADDTYDWLLETHGKDFRSERIAKDALVPPPPKPESAAPPPNTLGIGSEEDTLQAWKALRPKPVKKDERRLVQYEGKILRFRAKFTKPKYVCDHARRFIVSFFLADRTLKVFEPVVHNSGIQGGKFLDRRIMRNPATGKYFHEEDFIIGDKVTIASTEFELLGCDDFTTKFLNGEMELHEMKGIDEVEHLLREKIAANAINIRKSFRKA